MVPSEDEGKPHQPGEPELPPEQIQAKIEKDRALWYKHADGLKAAALEAVPVAKAHDLDGLFKVGDKVDKACEACHLEYWYRATVKRCSKIRTAKSPTTRPRRSSRQFQKLSKARRGRVDRARHGRIRPRVHRALDGY